MSTFSPSLSSGSRPKRPPFIRAWAWGRWSGYQLSASWLGGWGGGVTPLSTTSKRQEGVWYDYGGRLLQEDHSKEFSPFLQSLSKDEGHVVSWDLTFLEYWSSEKLNYSFWTFPLSPAMPISLHIHVVGGQDIGCWYIYSCTTAQVMSFIGLQEA